MNPELRVYYDMMEQLKRDPNSLVWTGDLDFFGTEVEGAPSLSAWIEERVTSPELFLGKGGAGHVFELGARVCIKLVENRHAKPDAQKYDLGNNIRKESYFQHKLKKLATRGVRTPLVYGFFEGPNSEAMLMEKVVAVNLQEVLAGTAVLPETFDSETFFDSLDDYVQDMHDDFGVAHNDLEARNVMVDSATGAPIVIDFGRALEPKDEKFEDAKRDDIKNLASMQETIEALFTEFR